MIYTVTLNPSIDYIVHVEALQLGELNRMKQDFKLPGGKGINVSRIFTADPDPFHCTWIYWRIHWTFH